MTIVPLGGLSGDFAALAELLESGWPAYYGPSGPGSAMRDLTERATGWALPLGWAATNGEGNAIGTVALTGPSFGSAPDEGVWLGGLIVAPAARRQGVATALVQCVCDFARDQGFPALHSVTQDAQGLLLRLGWRQLRRLDDDGKVVSPDQPGRWLVLQLVL